MKTVYKVLGTLLFIETTLMVWCLAMSIYYGEDDMLAFAVSLLLTVGGALAFKYKGRTSEGTLTRRGAYLVVSLAWVIFSIFGMLPFLISGYIDNVTDAFFETMSGFTTTGATIISDVERLPHGLLFWRSLTQWIGGLGIVFFTIALLPSMVGGTVRVFAAEATGPIRAKLHPRISTGAMWIWSIYVFLTVACMACFVAFGMNWFDSLNYAMTSTATGGFSTHNDTAVFFDSAAFDYTFTFFCFLAGINFTLLYQAIIKRRPRSLWGNVEFRFYLAVIVVTSLLIAGVLIWRNGFDVEQAIRTSLFEVVSFITSTGLLTDDTTTWPGLVWGLMMILMVVGGSSGSTSGGIKCIRAVMILKTIKNELLQILHPNAIIPLKINGTNVPQQKRVTLLAFLSAYIIIFLLAIVAFSLFGLGAIKSATIALSCLSNTGPSLVSDTGEIMSWTLLPAGVKWICTALMLIGRLEIFSVLVIFTREFWEDN